MLEQYRYDAFGTPTFFHTDANGNSVTTSESVKDNRYLFTGREWNSNLGFYEYRARAYHPGIGRFMSEDPKGFDAGDYNLYRYCKNDPWDLTDPTGLTDIEVPHAFDVLGRDAALNSLHEAIKAGGDHQNRSQLIIRRGGSLMLQKDAAGNDKFNKQTEGTHREFKQMRLQLLPFNKEGYSLAPGETRESQGHSHLDVTGRDPHGRLAPSSSGPSPEDRAAGLGYRVNESNPNIIYRMTPQVEGGPAVERKLDAKTLVPIPQKESK